MGNIVNQIEACGIVPVVVLERLEDAAKLACALQKGGLLCAEVTFRTEVASKALRRMVETVPEMLVGAGSIRSVEQVKQAVEAGAKFIVSPGFDEAVVEYCLKERICVIPGCVTPTEIGRAMHYGLEIVKFFPAEVFGGVDALRALSGPFGKMRFMPTGGIHRNNLSAYLNCKQVVACGGSWMVAPSLIVRGAYEEIADQTKEAVELVRRVRQKIGEET